MKLPALIFLLLRFLYIKIKKMKIHQMKCYFLFVLCLDTKNQKSRLHKIY